MDNMNLESDLCMSGMTLRYLLENRDLIAVPPRAKNIGKDDRSNADIYADATASLLGPNIWDKTLQDFKPDYMDLDALLGTTSQIEIQAKIKEQNVPQILQLETTTAQLQELTSCNTTPQNELPSNSQSPPPVEALQEQESKDSKSSTFSMDNKFSPTDLAFASPPGHDASSELFPVEHFKPQPIMKKSRKHFVPESLKDDKYWARRRKNNIAAKRSREARRLKENQIVLRASYLEKENNSLKEDVMRLKAENDMLKMQLKEFQQS